MVVVQKPKLQVVLEEFSWNGNFRDDYLEKVEISNQIWEDFYKEEFEFDGCSLKKVDLTSSKDTNFSFIDSKLEFCDCSNLSLSFKSVIRCHFLDCKFVGLDLSEELVKDVVFESCDFTLSNFSNIQFQNVIFKNCKFLDTRFFSCRFKEVEFLESMLDHIEVFRSPLTGVDLSTSTLVGGKFCVEDLKGAIVNSEQALVLAKLLGIVIADE